MLKIDEHQIPHHLLTPPPVPVKKVFIAVLTLFYGFISLISLKKQINQR